MTNVSPVLAAPPGRLCTACQSCSPSRWDEPRQELPAGHRRYRGLRGEQTGVVYIVSLQQITQSLTRICQFVLLTQFAVKLVENPTDPELSSHRGGFRMLENLREAQERFTKGRSSGRSSGNQVWSVYWGVTF